MTCVLFAYYFANQIYTMAHEMRPYALWASVYFVALAVSSRCDNHRRLFILTLIILALSSVAALFQISAMALSYGVVNAAHSLRTKRTQQMFSDIIKVFGVPLVVVLYYCWRRGHIDPPFTYMTWDQFWPFWFSHIVTVPWMLVISVICFANAATRKCAIAPLAFLFVYLMGPLLHWSTLLKGRPFWDRHYLYYDLKYAVVLMTAVQCLPAYINRVSAQKIVPRVLRSAILIGSCLVGAWLALRPDVTQRFQTAYENANVVSAHHLRFQIIPKS